jgi:hypothetical protein
MAEQNGLFALFNGLRMHLGDEPRQPHAREELGIHIIALVVGVGDGSQALGMSKDEEDSGFLEQIEEPGPSRARFDHNLHRVKLP